MSNVTVASQIAEMRIRSRSTIVFDYQLETEPPGGMGLPRNLEGLRVIREFLPDR